MTRLIAALAFTAVLAGPAFAAPDTAPDALVRTSIDEVVAIIKADHVIVGK